MKQKKLLIPFAHMEQNRLPYPLEFRSLSLINHWHLYLHSHQFHRTYSADRWQSIGSNLVHSLCVCVWFFSSILFLLIKRQCMNVDCRLSANFLFHFIKLRWSFVGIAYLSLMPSEAGQNCGLTKQNKKKYHTLTCFSVYFTYRMGPMNGTIYFVCERGMTMTASKLTGTHIPMFWQPTGWT